MITRIVRVAALLVAAGIGLYIGDVLGSRPLDALPYEYWCPTMYEKYYHRAFVGVFTTSFAYLASKFLRVPEVVALLVAFAYSIYLPIREMSIVGEALFSVPAVYTLFHYQAPFFLGLLIAFGIVHVGRLSLQSFRRSGNARSE